MALLIFLSLKLVRKFISACGLLALLDYRNTSQQGQEHSPAQRLISQRTRGTLPITPALLQPEVAHHAAGKTDIGARRIRAKPYYDRNLGGKAHNFSLARGYMPNPTLSTRILPGRMALYRKCPHPGHTLLSLLMVDRCAEMEHRSGWPQPHHLMRRPTCPSSQVHPVRMTNR